MAAAEFDDWVLYERLEPFGEPRADLRAGLICATTFNMNKAGKVEPKSPLDFMPFIKDAAPPRPPSPEELHQKMKAWLPPQSPPPAS